MHPGPATDLHWTAFRYVAGELSPAEASDFEILLADDQEAREAVAAAVELAGALLLAGDGPILTLPRERPTSRRYLAWSGAAVAAAATLMAYLGPIRPADPAKDATIALAWSGFRAVPDGEWTPIDAEAAHEPATPAEAEAVADVEADASAERGVPSWMLAAAAAPKTDAPAREGN